MGCIIEGPFISGFTIELENNNLHINVQDNFRGIVDNATVNIVASDFTASGLTDYLGNYETFVPIDEICTLTISKIGLFDFNQRFALTEKKIVGNEIPNIVFKIVDSANNPLENVDIEILNNNQVVYSGVTDNFGYFFGLNNDITNNTVNISKVGFETKSISTPKLIKIKSTENGFDIATVIELNIN